MPQMRMGMLAFQLDALIPRLSSTDSLNWRNKRPAELGIGAGIDLSLELKRVPAYHIHINTRPLIVPVLF
jgi:hypothetical protein